MASKNYFWSGKCMWAKLEEPDAKYEKWTLDFYPDDKGWEEFRESGLGVEVRKNKETDEEYIKLSRPVQKKIKEELVDFDKPLIIGKDNEPMEDRPLIGNGSEVTVKVLIYDTKRGKGHRLEAVRIDNLVEYVGKTDDESPF